MADNGFTLHNYILTAVNRTDCPFSERRLAMTRARCQTSDAARAVAEIIFVLPSQEVPPFVSNTGRVTVYRDYGEYPYECIAIYTLKDGWETFQ